MNPQAAQHYLRTKVFTATPEQLQLMLYDGAIRFAEQARAALAARQYDQSYNLIARVQKILTELACTLKHDVEPQLCARLGGLYNYAYQRLIAANVEHRLEALDEALGILRYQRETWAMLLAELARQKAGRAAAQLNVPPPDRRMEASISMQG